MFIGDWRWLAHGLKSLHNDAQFSWLEYVQYTSSQPDVTGELLSELQPAKIIIVNKKINLL
jgi:hypothetical protein